MESAHALSYAYLRGLRYTLLLNVIGIGFVIRSWQGDLYVLRGTTTVPRWFLILLGALLQIPGLFYLAVGAWATCTTPGVQC